MIRTRTTASLASAGVVVAALVSGGGTAAASAHPTIQEANTATSLNCDWHPANNSGAPGGWNYGVAIMRGGAHHQCGIVGYGYPGDPTYMHCQHTDGAGTVWVYLTDYRINRAGWVVEDEVHWSGGALKQC
jgi:hypothetical protein